VADGALRRGHVLGHPFAIGVRAGLLEVAVEHFEDAGEAEAFVGFFGGRFGGRGVGVFGAVGRRIAIKQ